MFEIGWTELMLILVVALVVVKPDQLPQTAKSLGRAYRQLREIISESGRALEKEAAEIRKLNPMNEFTEPADRSESDRTGRT